MGATDASGNEWKDAAPAVGTALASTHKAVNGVLDTNNNDAASVGLRAPTANPQQPSWAHSSADLSGGYAGRHTLRMDDFLNVFTQQVTQLVNCHKEVFRN